MEQEEDRGRGEGGRGMGEEERRRLVQKEERMGKEGEVLPAGEGMEPVQVN